MMTFNETLKSAIETVENSIAETINDLSVESNSIAETIKDLLVESNSSQRYLTSHLRWLVKRLNFLQERRQEYNKFMCQENEEEKTYKDSSIHDLRMEVERLTKSTSHYKKKAAKYQQQHQQQKQQQHQQQQQQEQIQEQLQEQLQQLKQQHKQQQKQHQQQLQELHLQLQKQQEQLQQQQLQLQQRDDQEERNSELAPSVIGTSSIYSTRSLNEVCILSTSTPISSPPPTTPRPKLYRPPPPPLPSISYPIGTNNTNELPSCDPESARRWFEELMEAGPQPEPVNEDSFVNIFKFARGEEESSVGDERSIIVKEPQTCTNKVSNFFRGLPKIFKIKNQHGEDTSEYDSSFDGVSCHADDWYMSLPSRFIDTIEKPRKRDFALRWLGRLKKKA